MSEKANANLNVLKGTYVENIQYFFQDFPHGISGQNEHISSFLVDETGYEQPVGSVEVKKEAWVLHKSSVYEKTVCKQQQKYQTNIEEKKFLAMKSRAIDHLVQDLLYSKQYTVEHMLILDNPYQLAPLTCLILFYTEVEYKIRVTVKGKNDGDDIFGVTDMEHYHKVPVFGLYPEIENKIILEFLDKENRCCKKMTFLYQGCVLPKELRNIVSVGEHHASSALPLIFVYGAYTQYPYAFDSQGDIRYYLCKSPNNYGLYFLSEGKILLAEKLILAPSFLNPHAIELLEMDLMGRIYHMFHVEQGVHHDVCEMWPGGNFLAASNCLEGTVEDTIIEIHRKTGKIVKEVKMSQIFDATYQDDVDWAHINSVSYDTAAKTVIVCLRNLHSVIALDWEKERLVWLLGHPDFWKGTKMERFLLHRKQQPGEKESGDDGWFYQPHSAYYLSSSVEMVGGVEKKI